MLLRDSREVLMRYNKKYNIIQSIVAENDGQLRKLPYVIYVYLLFFQENAMYLLTTLLFYKIFSAVKDTIKKMTVRIGKVFMT